MGSYLLKVCLLLLCVNQSYQRLGFAKDRIEGVIDLTVKTIKTAPKENEFLLVFFYSGVSKHTKEAEAQFIELTQRLKKSSSNIVVARMDRNIEIDPTSDLHVIELPMYMLFKNGKPHDFRGILNPDHVLTWIEVAMNVPLVVNSLKHLTELKTKGTAILGCFPGKSPKDNYDAFFKASRHFVSLPYMPLPRFAVVESASAMREIGIPKGSVTVYKHFEVNGKATYDGEVTDHDKLLKWIHDQTEPVVYPFGHPEYTHRMASSSIKYDHVLIMPSTASNFQTVFDEFKKAARDFRTSSDDIQCMFIYVDSTLQHLQKVISFFHVNADKDLPCNRITKLDEYHSRFAPNSVDLTYFGFTKFTKEVMQGKVLRSVRSQHIPENWDRLPVKELVGENYEEVTRQMGKIAFIFYYVDKDSGCDRMVPVVEELGRIYRGNSSVIIGQMNVAYNDGEIDCHYNFPNFKLINSKNKRIKYNGDRNVNAMKKFIESDGKVQIGAPPPKKSIAQEHLEFLEEQDEKMPKLILQEEEERRKVWEKEDEEMLRDAVTYHEEGGLPHERTEAHHEFERQADKLDAHVDVAEHVREHLKGSGHEEEDTDVHHIYVGHDHTFEL